VGIGGEVAAGVAELPVVPEAGGEASRRVAMRAQSPVDESQRAAYRQRGRAAAASRSDDIAALEDLRDQGVLTEEDFQHAKQKTAA
jgi:hypothetical protein